MGSGFAGVEGGGVFDGLIEGGLTGIFTSMTGEVSVFSDCAGAIATCEPLMATGGLGAGVARAAARSRKRLRKSPSRVMGSRERGSADREQKSEVGSQKSNGLLAVGQKPEPTYDLRRAGNVRLLRCERQCAGRSVCG